MNILNKEELKRQIQEGKEISLDGILDEFKSLLREFSVKLWKNIRSEKISKQRSMSKKGSTLAIFNCKFGDYSNAIGFLLLELLSLTRIHEFI